MSSLVIFPHHLFSIQRDTAPARVTIWEDPACYGHREGDVPSMILEFNRLRLVYMRASVRRYVSYLRSMGVAVDLVEVDSLWGETLAKRQTLFKDILKGKDVKVYDPMDHLIEKAYRHLGGDWVDTPMFVLSNRDVKLWLDEKSKGNKSNFRIQMTPVFNYVKTKIKFLIGVASTDKDNRSPYPKKGGEEIPSPYVDLSKESEAEWKSAWTWVKAHKVFKNYPGSGEKVRYPLTHDEAMQWMRKFFTERFKSFGRYEDAVVPGEPWLFHSGLSIPLNSGLLTPMDVLEELKAMKANNARITNLEGFTRQLFGWREYARVYYQCVAPERWRKNVFNCRKKMDRKAWINGTTGIPAVDDAIDDAWKHGYLHHIRRLMIVGNWCTINEIDPDEVYKWLFEFSLDSNPWTMAFNVFAMGTWSDGGIAMRKPYISSSNYIQRMVNPGIDDDPSWASKWDKVFDDFVVSRGEILLHTQLAGIVRRKRKLRDMEEIDDD
jgi:deoxyribodipyrimidine photolyase-related protein